MDTTRDIGIDDIDLVGMLMAAAATAGRAPSIHNTQPWRWRIHGRIADLYADTRRQLRTIDPDRRLMTVSCGAALHHARVALAAEGVAFDVDLLPADGDPDYLARITAIGTTPATDADARLGQILPMRHTDRRPLCDEPLPAGAFEAMREIVTGYGIGLHPLARADVLDLAAATSRAQHDEVTDLATLHELDAWTGAGRPVGAGVPDANIPSSPTRTTVPSRDFGHVGALPTSEGHDNAAAYALLYGLDDEPRSWLRAGEALSALWLYATAHDIAVLPLSAAVEEPHTRQALHRVLSGLGYAHLAIRLGVTDPDRVASARTPRLPTEATVEIG